MKSINKILLSGIPHKNNNLQQLELYHLNSLICIIPYNKLTPSNWGYIYERFVGLHYEALGYAVEYQGLKKGFLDNGIDLICSNDYECLCIQCKYIHKKLSKQNIEWILYKASSFFVKKKFSIKPTLLLIVPNMQKVLTKELKEYIISKNYTQNYTYVKILELDF